MNGYGCSAKCEPSVIVLSECYGFVGIDIDDASHAEALKEILFFESKDLAFPPPVAYLHLAPETQGGSGMEPKATRAKRTCP